MGAKASHSSRTRTGDSHVQELWQNWRHTRQLWQRFYTGKDKNNAKGQSKGKWVDVVQTSQPSKAFSGAFLVFFLHRHRTQLKLFSAIQTRSKEGGTLSSLLQESRQFGAEYLLVDICAQFLACPTENPGQRVYSLDLGLHTASGARLQHVGGRSVRFQLLEGRTIQMLSHVCDVQKPIIPSFVSLSRIFELTLFFTNRIQTQLSQTQLHKGDRLFVVKGMLMAPLGDSWCE